MTDNEYILEVFETHYVKNLRLTYEKRQRLNNVHSIAIATQRSIFCLFENLTVCKSQTAFGYITLEDQNRGFNPTGYIEQCYVSSNFRNIRIYETSGYALDFKKELPLGDSGSVYDNFYINSNDWLSSTRDNISIGAIRGESTVACFTQLNIEGAYYTSHLIDITGMSRLTILSCHIEGLNGIPAIAQLRGQSDALFSIIDINSCSFRNTKSLFQVKDLGNIEVSHLLIRNDCKSYTPYKVYVMEKMSNTSCDVKISKLFDGINIINKK